MKGARRRVHDVLLSRWQRRRTTDKLHRNYPHRSPDPPPDDLPVQRESLREQVSSLHEARPPRELRRLRRAQTLPSRSRTLEADLGSSAQHNCVDVVIVQTPTSLASTPSLLGPQETSRSRSSPLHRSHARLPHDRQKNTAPKSCFRIPPSNYMLANQANRVHLHRPASPLSVSFHLFVCPVRVYALSSFSISIFSYTYSRGRPTPNAPHPTPRAPPKTPKRCKMPCHLYGISKHHPLVGT